MKTEKKATEKPVKDERDHKIHQHEYTIRNLTMKLEAWRKFGKLHGPVSTVNDINAALIELKELGELGD